MWSLHAELGNYFLSGGLPVVTAEFLLRHFLLTLIYKSVDIFWDSSDLSHLSRFFWYFLTFDDF